MFDTVLPCIVHMAQITMNTWMGMERAVDVADIILAAKRDTVKDINNIMSGLATLLVVTHKAYDDIRHLWASDRMNVLFGAEKPKATLIFL